MIAAKLTKPDGSIALMFILEPGNIYKLKSGEPIHKWLNEFMPELQTPLELLLAYTPDAVWVSEQMQGNENPERLAQVLTDSLARPEVIWRGKTAEDMKRVI